MRRQIPSLPPERNSIRVRRGPLDEKFETVHRAVVQIATDSVTAAKIESAK
jgi:hypothetical protein